MTAPFLVRGDHFPALDFLSATQSAAVGSPRALIWGADLRDYPLAGKARSRLKEACKEAYEYALKWPSVRHLIVTYVRHPDVRTSACLSLAERSGSRIHADAERARGRYLDVVTLDITGCEDAVHLRDRIVEAISTRPSPAGHAALEWREITTQTIHEAAMQYVY